jgi:hypothetical protein
VLGLLDTSIMFLIIYYKALVIDATGYALLNVNGYNEGWIEFLMFVIFLAVAIYKFKLIINQKALNIK